MFREKCTVIDNKKVAPGHFVLRVGSSRIGRAAKPGQFVQILCSNSFEPLLPRPFSFLTASSRDFSILYQVVGTGTQLLSQAKKGDTFSVTGPLGNGFLPENQESCAVLVGGGVGIPPLYHLAEQRIKGKTKRKKENIHVFLGARDKSLLLCEKDFKELGVELHIATDNGSKGHHGFITEILDSFLRQRRPPLRRHPQLAEKVSRSVQIFTCGPTPMLKAVSFISQKYGVDCEVSVEVPMACGFGACLGCAIKVKNNNTHRFAIACCEGPVFQGEAILWD